MRGKLGTILTFGLCMAAAACGGVDAGSDTANATSMPFAHGSAEGDAILAVANDTSLDFDDYNDRVKLHKTAARKLVEFREDQRFTELKQVWKLSYCKTKCFNSLLQWAKDHGMYGGNERISVIMSPQSGLDTHLQRIADTIDAEADETIDIAMYSYSSQDPVKGALQRALDRGVKIRFLAETDLANSESKGGALENMGIDVRRVTKIMHHKFAIIDGPRDNDTLDRADDTVMITGSANWSGSAATKYDENTLFIDGGYPELALRLQRDFDTIWAGSKDKVYVDFEWDQTRGDITDELIAGYEDANNHAYFTSYNFRSNAGGSWSVLDSSVVADQLSVAILGATDSIEIASGHFVSIPIAQAVVDAMRANPDLNVDIALDCQETTKKGEIRDLKADIIDMGGSIVYKCNTYRWHYKYAAQMHHKYMIIDGVELYTGSYNMSDNAEHNTFENMLYFTGSEHASLIDKYLANHDMVKNYGAEDDLYQDLIEDVETADNVPLTWSNAISMSLSQFNGLKGKIRDRCPATKSWENTGPARTYNKYFNQQPHWFARCSTSGYPWPMVPENLRQ